jgi:hypothetical protein
MLDYLAFTTDWLQQHVAHLLLRRYLAHWFEDPVALSQLQVQLRQHNVQSCMEWTAKLTNVRISRAALAPHLVWRCTLVWYRTANSCSFCILHHVHAH